MATHRETKHSILRYFLMAARYSEDLNPDSWHRDITIVISRHRTLGNGKIPDDLSICGTPSGLDIPIYTFKKWSISEEMHRLKIKNRGDNLIEVRNILLEGLIYMKADQAAASCIYEAQEALDQDNNFYKKRVGKTQDDLGQSYLFDISELKKKRNE